MGYFRELPNVAYKSPLSHTNSSGDYIFVKNIFRKTKMMDWLSSNATLFNKFQIGDGDRPDTIAEAMYGDPTLDYVVILTAGITNIRNEWKAKKVVIKRSKSYRTYTRDIISLSKCKIYKHT